MSDWLKFIALTLFAALMIVPATITDFLHNRLHIRFPSKIVRAMLRWQARKMRVQILILNAKGPDPIFEQAFDSLYKAEMKYL